MSGFCLFVQDPLLRIHEKFGIKRKSFAHVRIQFESIHKRSICIEPNTIKCNKSIKYLPFFLLYRCSLPSTMFFFSIRRGTMILFNDIILKRHMLHVTCYIKHFICVVEQFPHNWLMYLCTSCASIQWELWVFLSIFVQPFFCSLMTNSNRLCGTEQVATKW